MLQLLYKSLNLFNSEAGTEVVNKFIIEFLQKSAFIPDQDKPNLIISPTDGVFDELRIILLL
ncbi:hypothetical protein CWM56_10690 [Klebsiella sp. E-Nf3]|nr:hypothetical protein CWM56_10690 [Klebsiella sp. E-Nf3]HBX4391945.1 hypothetical protein [Klebsiella pneumoniae]HBY7190656.1 hypothetical protein [Klebsiella pneumoniae]